MAFNTIPGFSFTAGCATMPVLLALAGSVGGSG